MLASYLYIMINSNIENSIMQDIFIKNIYLLRSLIYCHFHKNIVLLNVLVNQTNLNISK